MAPTPSVYLYTGEDAVDETVWPPTGLQTKATEPQPLYHFAGDNQTADPPTTNGANVPGWELYAGATEPVADTAAATPPAPSGAEPASEAPSSPDPALGAPPPGSSQPATSAPSGEPTATAESAPAASEQPQTPAESAPQDATPAAPIAPEQPATPPAASGVAAAAVEPLTTSPVPPAVIEGIVYRGRDDNDVLSGSFCRVIAGEHQGRYGVLTGTATLFPDGWPATVTVRTRDDRDEYIAVNYADIRPAQPGGR